jgi:hypothetical protein
MIEGSQANSIRSREKAFELQSQMRAIIGSFLVCLTIERALLIVAMVIVVSIAASLL